MLQHGVRQRGMLRSRPRAVRQAPGQSQRLISQRCHEQSRVVLLGDLASFLIPQAGYNSVTAGLDLQRAHEANRRAVKHVGSFTALHLSELWEGVEVAM
jgi:hypothetical protein